MMTFFMCLTDQIAPDHCHACMLMVLLILFGEIHEKSNCTEYVWGSKIQPICKFRELGDPLWALPSLLLTSTTKQSPPHKTVLKVTVNVLVTTRRCRTISSDIWTKTDICHWLVKNKKGPKLGKYPSKYP